ncbi:Zn(2+)-responsive transcriptional regulator [Aestuariibacter sp. A3R04]|uniref:Zn(2+)-responsive transcriptional regulator n=1 Tax=Aestuariibacter sp. A3R04 TaxID=2841571 RepID=UPI001C07F88C|nr:Zn(2+)-responsive transcriptional regulator [Aestuariibacter sp. A3R04]MBU3020851.1 Zn(2+)-responsive transcriptional regulator [Aestuariibacter sp. A3R04]
MNTEFLKIGELAKRTGLTVDTIRFYEEQGLIRPSRRSAAGYRQFSQRDLEKLQFIQRTKAVGFTLKEIGELLALKLHPDDHTCMEVKEVTEQKIDEVSKKINELEKIRSSLRQLAIACDGGPHSAEHCNILQLLDSDRPL